MATPQIPYPIYSNPQKTPPWHCANALKAQMEIDKEKRKKKKQRGGHVDWPHKILVLCT